MHFAIKHFSQDHARYTGKLNYKIFISWLLTLMIVLVGLKLCREAVSNLLWKLYELLIQEMN